MEQLLSNSQLSRFNILLNQHFILQLDEKKSRNKTEKRYLIFINSSKFKKIIGANFFDKKTLFIFEFHLTNVCFLKVSICAAK